MGCVKGVGIDSFPPQGKYLHAPVRVYFNYETSRMIPGVIVRDDMAEPFRTIIRLDDGRFVLTTECQWAAAPAPENAQ